MSRMSLEALTEDLRHALRALRHSRRFAAGVVGSLAIGMAVTIAALALLNATMILPFPHVSEQERLVRLAVSRTCGRPDCRVPMATPRDYDALREGLSGVQDLAAYTAGEIAVALPEARSIPALVTSTNYFDVLGARPILGRVFDAVDDDTDAAVAVIGYGLWVREFKSDPSVVGHSIRVADRFVQVIGVAPERFIGIDRIRPGGHSPDLWLPLWLADRVLPWNATERRREERDLAFVGRLADGIQVPQLQSEADVVAQRLAAGRAVDTNGARAEVARVWRVRPESWKYGVVVVMPIPILVLVIACVNAANLMLARGSQRHREIAIRLALGAPRRRIVRELLMESAALALLATAVALPVAWWGLDLASTPIGEPISFDPLVLGTTILTAAITTVAFGLAPALRISARQPPAALGPASSRSDATPQQSRGRRVLVVAQVALSLGVLATAWQLIATVRSQAVSAGTPAERLLMARFDLQPLNLLPGESDRFYRDLLAGASRLPGVEAAGVARASAIWTFGQGPATASLVVWGPSDAREEGRPIIGGYADGHLFDAVGLHVIAGRSFDETDRQGRPGVAVVNETVAKTIGGAVVGTVLHVAPRGGSYEAGIDVQIVGVIEPSIEPRLEQGTAPAGKVYLPSPIEPEPALALYLRSSRTATALAQPVRELVGRIAPRVPVKEIGSLEDYNERSYATQLWLARAAALLGCIGLLLAAAGLYGVASYLAAMRSREIAIRMALGANPGTILSMILGQSMQGALVGLAIGGVAAAAVSRVIQSEYHGIHGIDITAFGGSAALFLASMFLASALPAIRASRVDPIVSLKDG